MVVLLLVLIPNTTQARLSSVLDSTRKAIADAKDAADRAMKAQAQAAAIRRERLQAEKAYQEEQLDDLRRKDVRCWSLWNWKCLSFLSYCIGWVKPKSETRNAISAY